MTNPFAELQSRAWPYWYRASLQVSQICGGVPASESVAEGWIRAKLKDTRSEAEVRQLVAQTKQDIRESHAAARRASAEAETEAAEASGALAVVAEATAILEMDEGTLTDLAVAKTARDMAGLNMFKRTHPGMVGGMPPGAPEGTLYIEGRQIKAALKEGVAVAANAGKISTKSWGNPDNSTYKKQLKGWFPEHVFVPEFAIPLMRNGEYIKEPDGVLQKFIHTHRGDAIGYEEYVQGADITFTVKTDVELTFEQWGMIWLTGQDQGIGASRSQGYGVYEVTGWEQLPPPGSKGRKK